MPQGCRRREEKQPIAQGRRFGIPIIFPPWISSIETLTLGCPTETIGDILKNSCGKGRNEVPEEKYRKALAGEEGSFDPPLPL